MILFARENFLLLLLLVPLIPVVYGIMRYMRRRRVLRLGDEGLVRELMPSWSRS